MRVDELAVLVEEDRRRERDARLDLRRDLEVRVAVARIRHGELLQELAGVAVVVLAVKAQERNLLAKSEPRLLKRGELATARRAPRRPLVHDYGVPAQLLHARVEVALLPADQLIRLVVQRLQLGCCAGECTLDLRLRGCGALRLRFAATSQENGGQKDWDCNSHADKASHSGRGNDRDPAVARYGCFNGCQRVAETRAAAARMQGFPKRRQYTARSDALRDSDGCGSGRAHPLST